MRVDMHVHVVGNGKNLEDINSDVYFEPGDNQHWLTKTLYALLEHEMVGLGADLNNDGRITTDEYFELLYRLVSTSREVDGVVLLALDAVYSPRSGELRERETDLWVSNRFLAQRVAQLNERVASEADESKRNKRFFFGASVSPNRNDWRAELEYVLRHTDAVLVKLIPSVQHIRMMDSRHDEFFDELAVSRMPLLCHVGPEYSFPEGIRNRRLDRFQDLERAIDRGVTVIAAHCATPVFPLFDRDEIREFYAFMKRVNSDGTVRLWADTSALSLSTRIPLIQRILDLLPSEWLVSGSDFPIPIDGWAHLPWLTQDVDPSEYLKIIRTKNPLDRDVLVKRAMGFPDSILSNAERLLRM